MVQLGDGHSVTLSSVTGANGQIVVSGDGYDVQLSYTYAEEIKAAANATFSVSVSDAGAHRPFRPAPASPSPMRR